MKIMGTHGHITDYYISNCICKATAQQVGDTTDAQEDAHFLCANFIYNVDVVQEEDQLFVYWFPRPLKIKMQLSLRSLHF